jgi:hypothetical protein
MVLIDVWVDAGIFLVKIKYDNNIIILGVDVNDG